MRWMITGTQRSHLKLNSTTLSLNKKTLSYAMIRNGRSDAVFDYVLTMLYVGDKRLIAGCHNNYTTFKNSITLTKFSCICVWLLRIFALTSSMASNLSIKWRHSSVLAVSCCRSKVTAGSSWRRLTVLVVVGVVDWAFFASRFDFHSTSRFFWPAKNWSHGWSLCLSSLVSLVLRTSIN